MARMLRGDALLMHDIDGRIRRLACTALSVDKWTWLAVVVKWTACRCSEMVSTTTDYKLQAIRLA